jgi:hypothetical protein
VVIFVASFFTGAATVTAFIGLITNAYPEKALGILYKTLANVSYIFIVLGILLIFVEFVG